MPTADPILEPAGEGYRFSLEPAHNALNSLMLLNRADHLSGMGSWVSRTAERLPAEQLHRNRLVLEGLHFAVLPPGAQPSFWAYLDALASADPASLRARLVQGLLGHRRPEEPAAAGAEELLASTDSYMAFLERRFTGRFDPDLEAEAYTYMVDPPRMQALIVGHLRAVWSEHLAAEWERTRGQLQEAVVAFRQLDLSAKTPREAIEAVTGQEPDAKICAAIAEMREVIFVPSPHLGPYMTKLSGGPQLRVFFGARLPAGVAAGPELSRADLLVRLGALSDETRLQVLALLAREGELCAPELMARLDLHQSAVSRHLRQLVATGYATERWRDGSKCYTLNRARLDDTLRALERFLT